MTEIRDGSLTESQWPHGATVNESKDQMAQMIRSGKREDRRQGEKKKQGWDGEREQGVESREREPERERLAIVNALIWTLFACANTVFALLPLGIRVDRHTGSTANHLR